jgi:hypothetical protein
MEELEKKLIELKRQLRSIEDYEKSFLCTAAVRESLKAQKKWVIAQIAHWQKEYDIADAVYRRLTHVSK